MTRLWEYVSTVISYWQFWLAVAFMLERSAERYLPTAWVEAVNSRLTAENRRKLFIGIAVFAFLFANFRAFDAEREAKERAMAERNLPPRDPVVLYQDGMPVATIVEPTIDQTASTLTFPTVTVTRPASTTKEFEFRTWKLTCVFGRPAFSSSFGAMQQVTYQNIACRIQGLR